MKNYITLLIITISTATLFGQNLNQDTLYYFQNAPITKIQFDLLNPSKTFTKTIKSDSALIQAAYLHKNMGHLNAPQYKQLSETLSNIMDSEFDATKNTLIHLYRSDEQIYQDAEYKKYWKWIDRNEDSFQSFLIGTKNASVTPDSKRHIYLDENNLIEKLFFKNSDFTINHLLIKPDGEVYIYFGLNDILEVLDLSV
ncbi:hypothetical protein GO491_08305 [Flavobacteriaceae bacterium Ap0902]|nr:hypothetical protein [Flavobacteriaceae bacterium Ap0902]